MEIQIKLTGYLNGYYIISRNSGLRLVSEQEDSRLISTEFLEEGADSFFFHTLA